MLNLNNTIHPHHGENTIYAGSDIKNAQSAMILIHGRGADAASMMSLVNEFKLDGFTYILPQATNYTWYPYRFIEKRDINEPGISSGLFLIGAIINALNQNNIPNKNIFLLGFSQGACLTLDYTAHKPAAYGGVFALSGGLIGDKLNEKLYSGDMNQTPVFLGCSDFDPHIPQDRVQQSANIFEKLNARITCKIYPDLGHAINMDEIKFVKDTIHRNNTSV